MSGRVGTLVCPACGAAVAKTAASCPYCGAVVVLPPPVGADGPAARRTFCARCGTLYPSEAARCPRCPPGWTDDRGGTCPRCAGPLETVPLGRCAVDRCAACGGHWFDGDELEHAADLTTQGVSREDAAAIRRSLPPVPAPEAQVRYVACVRCGERMTRRQIAPKTGIVVDVCRDHGVWFDARELEAFLDYVRGGGLEVLRHDGVAALEARRKAAAEGARPVPTSPMAGADLDSGADVFAAVLRALWRWLA